MRTALALATLTRHRARTALAIAGVAVASALLLDMVMLSTGMRESFRGLLEQVGFDLRVAPKGTLPFDTEATITGADSLLRRLAADSAIGTVSPVLATNFHMTGRKAATVFTVGIDPRVQGDYELLEGRNPESDAEIVASDAVLAAIGAAVGDSIQVGAGYDPQLRVAAEERRGMVVGRARFIYGARGQLIAAAPIATVQQLSRQPDRISLAMLRTRPGANADSVRARLAIAEPAVTVISTFTAIASVDERLSYFRQLSAVLGSLSLLVGFLLVTTIVTVSVNERLGEIAVLRALGVSRGHVVQQILMETVAITLIGALLGLVLGLVTARWLNGILSAFPGLPEGIAFFLFQPSAAWRSLGLLGIAAAGAAIYPSWRAASLPIAATLRREAIA